MADEPKVKELSDAAKKLQLDIDASEGKGNKGEDLASNESTAADILKKIDSDGMVKKLEENKKLEEEKRQEATEKFMEKYPGIDVAKCTFSFN